MPISSTDLIYKYSVATGPGNSTAGTPAGSLGGYVSITPIPDGQLDNIFDDVTGDENAALDVEYRCIFIHNNHATLTLLRTKVWMAAEVAGGANAAIALDSIGPTVLASSTPQASTDVNEDSLPSGAGAFSSPTTKVAGLSVGDIPPGYVAAIWIRRTATNSAAQNNDGLTIRVEGDTAA